LDITHGQPSLIVGRLSQRYGRRTDLTAGFMKGGLVDKFGRTAMAIASGATLLLAGLISAIAPGDSMILLVIALSLLG